jgi:hypothetical protein
MTENTAFIISQVLNYKDLNVSGFIINNGLSNLWGILLLVIILFLTLNRKIILEGFGSNKFHSYCI